jgi:hypothetical protein
MRVVWFQNSEFLQLPAAADATKLFATLNPILLLPTTND